jgi:FkbM family methyltransferase
MKKIIRKVLDGLGLNIIRNNRLPVGTDYRKTIRHLFKKEDIKVIFDVGANIGQFCIHCNEVFNASKIYSFEPIEKTFQILKNRTKKIPNILCYDFAFGSARGTEQVFLQNDSTINSLNPLINIQKKTDQASQQITIETIDNFCQEKNISAIDILKIDTEGFDLEVLKGARGMLAQRKIKFVFIEVTFDQDNVHNSSFSTINSVLAEYGFKIHGFYNQSIHTNSTQMNYCDALFYLQPELKA